MNLENQTPYLLISLVIVLILFLIGREIVCWYFKINKTITVLEEIRDLLKSPQQVVRGENKIEPHVGDNNKVQE